MAMPTCPIAAASWVFRRCASKRHALAMAAAAWFAKIERSATSSGWGARGARNTAEDAENSLRRDQRKGQHQCGIRGKGGDARQRSVIEVADGRLTRPERFGQRIIRVDGNPLSLRGSSRAPGRGNRASPLFVRHQTVQLSAPVILRGMRDDDLEHLVQVEDSTTCRAVS